MWCSRHDSALCVVFVCGGRLGSRPRCPSCLRSSPHATVYRRVFRVNGHSQTHGLASDVHSVHVPRFVKSTSFHLRRESTGGEREMERSEGEKAERERQRRRVGGSTTQPRAGRGAPKRSPSPPSMSWRNGWPPHTHRLCWWAAGRTELGQAAVKTYRPAPPFFPHRVSFQPTLESPGSAWETRGAVGWWGSREEGAAATVHPRKEEEVFSSHRTTQPDLLSAIF